LTWAARLRQEETIPAELVAYYRGGDWLPPRGGPKAHPTRVGAVRA